MSNLLKPLSKPRAKASKPSEPITEAEKSGVNSVNDVAAKILAAVQSATQPVPKKERKKRVLSDEQKSALNERLVKARAVRAANVAAKNADKE
jgi:hypothetical protein